jgi:hypothetical protein
VRPACLLKPGVVVDLDGDRAALGGRDAVVHLAAVLRSTGDHEIRQANLEATRTWPSRCGGRASGPGTSGCS